MLKKDVILIEYQKEHFNKLKQIIKENKIYIDYSNPGLGKTFIAIKLAQYFKSSLFIISPKSIIPKWKKEAKNYNINIIWIGTYQMFTGTINGISHPYLDIEDNIIEYGKNQQEMIKKDRFFITDKLINLLKLKKILFIFDEMQDTTNYNTYFYAVYTMINSIIEYPNAMVGLLSGSMFNKISQVQNIFKLLGIMKSTFLIENKNKKIGFDEIINYTSKINLELTNKLINENLIEETIKKLIESSNYIIFNLFIKIILPKFGSSMSSLKIKGISMKAYHGFFNLNYEQFNNLKLAYKNLEEIIPFINTNKNNINYTLIDNNNFGNFQPSLMAIEAAKIPIFARLTKNFINIGKLEKKPRKIVIFLMYINTSIIPLKKNLTSEGYKVITMTGIDSEISRDLKIKKFQDDNSEFDIIILQMKVGSRGIDLDDKTGKRPRVVLINPSTFEFEKLVQAQSRVYRQSTLSSPLIYFIFGKLDKTNKIINEKRIINNLKNKAIITRNIKGGIEKYPGEYPIIIEE